MAKKRTNGATLSPIAQIRQDFIISVANDYGCPENSIKQILNGSSSAKRIDPATARKIKADWKEEKLMKLGIR